METEDLYRFPTYPLLIVISGPSGAGKDRLIARMKELGYPFHFVVTATTRPQREGEVHGRDYFFVSTDEFAQMIEEDQLLEYAVVYGDYKGIPKEQVRQALASGKDVILRIDVQGAATIRRLIPEAVLIFVTAPSEEELIARLQARKTEPPDQLKLRIATSRQEMRRLPEFDYVVVNRTGELDKAVDQILAIITAEHCRVNPRIVRL
ncbi:MAG: guanylate kinase [Chloroflexi bacterium]|nr:MAG: guanylate kinase [Chloroflexota bacterium]